MYPATPLSMVVDSSLARTGFPIASLLVLASVLLLAGLFMVRSARHLSGDDR